MSDNDEVSVKEMLMAHIEDSRQYRVDTIKLIESYHNMSMEELKDIKNKTESHAIDIGKFNKIESFIDNISKASTWLFKFTLGFIAIGGAIWGAFVFIYNHIRQ